MAQHEPACPGELENRLDLIKGLIVKGLSQAEIVRYCREKCANWDVSDRQVRNYVASVWAALADEAEGIDRAAYFARTVNRLDFLYAQAVKVQDYRTARSITMDLVKLLRLDNPQFQMDWREAASQAGLSPGDVFERAVAAIAAMTGEEEVLVETDQNAV